MQKKIQGNPWITQDNLQIKPTIVYIVVYELYIQTVCSVGLVSVRHFSSSSNMLTSVLFTIC